jgi:hypothetical protein
MDCFADGSCVRSAVLRGGATSASACCIHPAKAADSCQLCQSAGRRVVVTALISTLLLPSGTAGAV